MHEIDCKTCRDWLHGYLDTELEANAMAEVAVHLRHCAECAAECAEVQRLITETRAHAPYHVAPAALRRSLLASIEVPAASGGLLQKLLGSRGWRWLAPGFSTLALALSLALYLATPSSEQPWLDEAVSSHVRSLMVDHLNDVASSDRHTVKPWFTGKLDFAPPVFDFSAQGYPLLGGRLDYLQQQNVAALTYGRARHLINLFVMPTTQGDSEPQQQTLRGYNLVDWRHDHLRFILVSDLEPGELQALGQLVRKGP
ncbi:MULTISPECIES: zf-HC2 domain-containing protein [unclassified Pseudomonas]|uniref:anti-sigma factor family protein n=1 Tax=unclassified Pseudomonas TaxID=196821 RepID=UPI0008384A33|nr:MULTISPECIES: zf-HC2 domain-containing protein [unclassified Pseudomonas]QIH06913.1 anti-sigma factor [Pseudomonas sp. BIOMIG1BAC]